MSATAGRLAKRTFLVGLIGALLASLLGLVACSGGNTGGPVGAPDVVVGKAPDVTLAAGTAEVIITSPTADASGAIDLNGRDGRLAVNAIGLAKPASVVIVDGVGYAKAPTDPGYVVLAGAVPQVLPNGDPWADIDLIRGTVHILSDGGGEVDGASTIGYTLTIDPQQAIETTPAPRQAAVKALLQGRTALVMIQVWIDTQYRIRRIEVPANFTNFKSVTPPTRNDGETIASDVDFVRFGVPVAPTAPPSTTGPPPTTRT